MSALLNPEFGTLEVISDLIRMRGETEIQELEEWVYSEIRADIGASAPRDNLELVKLGVAMGYECEFSDSGGLGIGSQRVYCSRPWRRIVSARFAPAADRS